MSKCAHLSQSEEAYRMVPGGGELVPAIVHLCNWADGNPDRLIDAPRWLTHRALAGEPVQPERDCAGCPGYRAAPPARQPQDGAK